MKNRYLYHVLPAIIAAVTLFSCKKTNSSSTTPTMKVTVAKPVVKDVILYKTYPSYLAAKNSVDLVARVDGYLINTYYTAGDIVNKGSLLIKIEPNLYIDQVNQAEAAYNSAAAQLEYAENNYTRMDKVAKSNAISQIDLLQAETQLISAKSNLASAKAQLKSAETNLSYCYIKAPYHGRVTLCIYSNDTYLAGAINPVKLATIYEEDLIYAYFNIEDNQYITMLNGGGGKILNDSVYIYLNGKMDSRYIGRIDYISPNVDLSTGTIRLRAEIENPKGDLKDGMYVNVSLPYGRKDSAVVVHNASIGHDQLGSFLYVVNSSDIVEYRHIEVGSIVNDTMRVVNSGIASNESYVLNAIIKVRNGMKVNPITIE